MDTSNFDQPPKWSEVVHIYIDGIIKGTEADNDELIMTASQELQRMAQLADKWVEHCKETQIH